jgi:hypothetical protein
MMLLIPRSYKLNNDQGYSVKVDVLLSISAIQDYDEITATLTFTAAFVFSWYDETKRWNPLDYSGINATKIPIMKTWMPQLVLRKIHHRFYISRFICQIVMKIFHIFKIKTVHF